MDSFLKLSQKQLNKIIDELELIQKDPKGTYIQVSINFKDYNLYWIKLFDPTNQTRVSYEDKHIIKVNIYSKKLSISKLILDIEKTIVALHHPTNSKTQISCKNLQS